MFLLWLGGAFASELGDAVLFFGLGWAASAHGGAIAGVVLSTVVLPRTVLLLVGGAVGDRAGARRVMVAGNAVMLAVAVALAVTTHWFGTPTILLVIAALVIGANDAFYLPSEGSIPRRLFGRDQLVRALALRQSGSQLVSMVGAPQARIRSSMVEPQVASATRGTRTPGPAGRERPARRRPRTLPRPGWLQPRRGRGTAMSSPM